MLYWRVICVQKFVLVILTVTVNEESKFPASAEMQNPNRRTNNCWTFSNIPAVVEIWNTKCIQCMLIAILYNES